MRYIPLFIIIASLSSCMDISTTTTYNRSFTNSSSESNKIPLSFSSSKGPVYYFVLVSSSSDDGTPHDLLKVRWVNPDKNHRKFNGMQSEVKFIIDKERIISLMPIKEPVLIGYDINNNTREEEAVYKISREQIKEIAYANTVEVELTGKNKIGFAKFNKWHSFRGFKKFLQES